VQWSGEPGISSAQIREWSHNVWGDIESLVQPESGTTTYSNFDVNGKPWITNYNGRIVQSVFDSLGRIRSLVANDGSVSQSFLYDQDEADHGISNGKLIKATQGAVVRSLVYSGVNGRLSNINRTIDGQTFSQALIYDNYGQLISRTYPDGKNQAIEYSNTTGLPSTTNFNGAGMANFGYDPVSWNLTTLAYLGAANGASSSFTYRKDQVGLASLAHDIPGKFPTPKIWKYGYDDLGHLGSDGEDWYSYDELGRLIGAFVRDPLDTAEGYANRGLMQTFGYDAFGNRINASTKTLTAWTANAKPMGTMSPTTILRAGLNTVTANASFSASDPAFLKNQMPETTTTGAHYDAQGNLERVYTTPGDTTTQVSMTYDALGRVTAMTSKAGSEQYLHDDEGLRIRIWDGTKYRYNIYNEARQLIAQYEMRLNNLEKYNDDFVDWVPRPDVVPEVVAINKLAPDGIGSLTWKKDIIYLGTKEIAEVSPTGTSITMCDHLGSPRFIWAGGSNPVIKQKFLPFGESLTLPTDAAGISKGFTNHEQTDASGLIYMQARFYLPMWGRFASPDPGRDQHFEETQSWNIYSYVQNNPVMNFDPNGEELRPADPNNQKLLDTVIAQLKRDPLLRGEIETVERSSRVVRVITTNDGDARYIGSGKNVIRWDPEVGRENVDDSGKADGSTASPSLRLGHELSHAAEDIRGGDMEGRPDARFDDTEERRVITGPERSAAKTLGQGVRNNHKGNNIKTVSPTSNVPRNKARRESLAAEKAKRKSEKQKKKEETK